MVPLLQCRRCSRILSTVFQQGLSGDDIKHKIKITKCFLLVNLFCAFQQNPTLINNLQILNHLVQVDVTWGSRKVNSDVGLFC